MRGRDYGSIQHNLLKRRTDQLSREWIPTHGNHIWGSRISTFINLEDFKYLQLRIAAHPHVEYQYNIATILARSVYS
jgi:hypothetical protein